MWDREMEQQGNFVNHSSSTSDFQQSCLEQQHSGGPSNFGETSNPSNGTATTSTLCPSVPVLDVIPKWLIAGPNPDERFLLLEDTDTGDVLMPMAYLKQVFQANYSRNVSNLSNRLVHVPPGADFGMHHFTKNLYWLWAFESPQHVKAIVRKELGETAAPAGHIRLVLLPVVYNAMRSKDALHRTPLFIALTRALYSSTYRPLLQHQGRLPSLDDTRHSPSPEPAASDPRSDEGGEIQSQPRPLFAGPRQLSRTAAKYMSTCKDTSCKRAKREESRRELNMVHDTSDSDLRIASMQEQLLGQKRHCFEQSTRLCTVERELAEMKVMVANVYKFLEGSKVADVQSREPALKLEPKIHYFNPQCSGSVQTVHSGQPGFWEDSIASGSNGTHRQPPGSAQPANFCTLNGMHKRHEQASAPLLYKDTPPHSSMRRQHSTGCLPLSSGHHHDGELSGLEPQDNPAAVTSHLLNLGSSPHTPLMQMPQIQTNLFGSVGNLLAQELPTEGSLYCQPLLAQPVLTNFPNIPDPSDMPTGNAPINLSYLFPSNSN